MDQKHANGVLYYKDLNENLARLTQKTEEPKYNKETILLPHTQ